MDYETLNQGNDEADENVDDDKLDGEEAPGEEDEEEDLGLESEDE
mgnify:FL=1